MSRLRLLGRLLLLYLAGSALGVLAPVWLVGLFLFFNWRRARERMSAWWVASLELSKGVRHGHHSDRVQQSFRG